MATKPIRWYIFAVTAVVVVDILDFNPSAPSHAAGHGCSRLLSTELHLPLLQ